MSHQYVAKPNIGFMQGRLSKIRKNRIQSFPWEFWKEEFPRANEIGLSIMEWTIDTEKFAENPLINSNGNEEIISLIEKFKIKVPSVTCDYFMENPPWKADYKQIKESIALILKSMKNIGSQILVIPLVDNSSVLKSYSIEKVNEFFSELISDIRQQDLKIAFESDLSPIALSNFINNFDEKHFGINYDIGNSTSLGFDPAEEFSAYGARIINVHVKDRKKNGGTVPLGDGDANFLKIFKLLQVMNYQGNLILQTARSTEGKDVDALVKYKCLVEKWWKEARNDKL